MYHCIQWRTGSGRGVRVGWPRTSAVQLGGIKIEELAMSCINMKDLTRACINMKELAPSNTKPSHDTGCMPR